MEKTFGEIKKGDYIWKTSGLQGDWTAPKKIRVFSVEDPNPDSLRIKISIIDRELIREIPDRSSISRPKIKKTIFAPPRERSSWDFYCASEEAALKNLLKRNKNFIREETEEINKSRKAILMSEERIKSCKKRIEIICQKLSNI